MLNKRELQQITVNHSSAEPYSSTIQLYHQTIFYNILEKIWKLIMTIDDKIRDEKIQYDISRKVSKISAVLSNKSNQHEYLTGEKKLSSHLKQ